MRTSIEQQSRPCERRRPWCTALVMGAVAMASILASGCAGTRHAGPAISPQRQEASANFDSGQLRAIGFSRGWRAYPIVTRGEKVELAEAYDDLLLVLEGGSTLSGVQVQDGDVRWSIQLDTPITPFLGIEREGNLIYTNSSSELYVVDAITGDLRARQTLPLVVSTPLVRHNGQLLFGCSDGQVYSYLPTRRVKLWGNQLDHPMLQPATLIDGIAAFVSEGGDVLFLDASLGTVVARAGGGSRTNALFDGPGARPAAAPGMLIVPSRDQSLWAFTPASSRSLWRVPTQAPITSRPVVYQDRVYIDLPEMGFSAVDLGTGQVLWSAPDLGGELVSVRDGLLIVFDASAQTLAQVDPATGDVFARVPVTGVTRVRTHALEDAPIYLITDRGLVAQFNPDA